MRRLKILIWHVHGSYLYYLTHAPHDFYLPFKPERRGHYTGKWGHIPWGDNVRDVATEDIKDLDLDCIIFQQPDQYLTEQYVLLSEQQRKLPKIYLEHDPPQHHPTDTKHWVNDPDMLLVHVTAFNRLMWDSGRTPTQVVEHGVLAHPEVRYTGELEKGIVIINHLKERGRRLGADVYADLRRDIPLDLVGMGAPDTPGLLGEVLHKDLPAFASRYRFFFNPIRYTSLGLAICEAMMIGLPIIGLATTELVTVVRNGVSGYVDTCPEKLRPVMQHLLKNKEEARRWGEAARQYALERFSIGRFVRDWNKALALATGIPV